LRRDRGTQLGHIPRQNSPGALFLLRNSAHWFKGRGGLGAGPKGAILGVALAIDLLGQEHRPKNQGQKIELEGRDIPIAGQDGALETGRAPNTFLAGKVIDAACGHDLVERFVQEQLHQRLFRRCCQRSCRHSARRRSRAGFLPGPDPFPLISEARGQREERPALEFPEAACQSAR
jgi:hypothetical protein